MRIKEDENALFCFSLASSEDTGKYFWFVIKLITVLKVLLLLCDLDALKKIVETYITIISSCRQEGKYQAPLPSEHGLAYGRWASSGLSVDIVKCRALSYFQQSVSNPLSYISIIILGHSFLPPCLAPFPLLRTFASCTVPPPNMHFCGAVFRDDGSRRKKNSRGWIEPL